MVFLRKLTSVLVVVAVRRIAVAVGRIAVAVGVRGGGGGVVAMAVCSERSPRSQRRVRYAGGGAGGPRARRRAGCGDAEHMNECSTRGSRAERTVSRETHNL